MKTSHQEKAMIIFGYSSALAKSLRERALKEGYTLFGVSSRRKSELEYTDCEKYIVIYYTEAQQEVLSEFLQDVMTRYDNLVLIYGASVWSSGLLGSYNMDKVQTTLQLGLNFPLLLLNLIADLSVIEKQIQVVLITGVLGDRAVSKGSLPYALAANGMAQMTLASAQELKDNTKVALLALGLFDKGQTFTQEARKAGIVIHEVSNVTEAVYTLATTNNPIFKSCIVDASISLFNYEKIISEYY